MKYCIGEFSSLLGITRDTLRLYEKHGIVRPVKDHNNSYRYFNDLDARDLLMSRWYRSLQIPLQDVAELIKHSSIDAVSAKLKASRGQLEAEIRKSAMLLNKLDEAEPGDPIDRSVPLPVQPQTEARLIPLEANGQKQPA